MKQTKQKKKTTHDKSDDKKKKKSIKLKDDEGELTQKLEDQSSNSNSSITTQEKTIKLEEVSKQEVQQQEKREKEEPKNMEIKKEDIEKEEEEEEEEPQRVRANSQPLPVAPKIDQDELIALAGADPAKLVEILRQRQSGVERRFIPVGGKLDEQQQQHGGVGDKTKKEERKTEKNEDKKETRFVEQNASSSSSSSNSATAPKSKNSNIVIVDNKEDKEEKHHIPTVDLKSDHFDSLKKLFNQLQKESKSGLHFNDYSKGILQMIEQMDDILKYAQRGLEKCLSHQENYPNTFDDETSHLLQYKSDRITTYFEYKMREIVIPPPPPPDVFIPPPPPPGILPPPPPPVFKSSPISRINRSTSTGSLTNKGVSKKPQFDPNAAVINAIKGGVKLRSVANTSSTDKEKEKVPPSSQPELFATLRRTNFDKKTNNDNDNDLEKQNPPSSQPELFATLRRTNFEKKAENDKKDDKSNIFGVTLRTVPKEDPSSIILRENSGTKKSRPTSWGPATQSLIKKTVQSDINLSEGDDRDNDDEGDHQNIDKQNSEGSIILSDAKNNETEVESAIVEKLNDESESNTENEDIKKEDTTKNESGLEDANVIQDEETKSSDSNQ